MASPAVPGSDPARPVAGPSAVDAPAPEVPRENRCWWRFWWPAWVWMGFIFIGSTDLLSFPRTSRFLGPWLRWLNPDITPDGIAQVQFLIRKLAHLTEYAVLALLVTIGLSRTFRLWCLEWSARRAWMALTLCAAYAATDELHQAFVSSRTGSPVDVGIDICGAALALGMLWLLKRGRGA
ncbi:MAG: VanZ family protein [Limisphaerales bacterium]